MEEYKPNSHRSKDEKKVVKAIDGKAKVAKKSVARRAVELFVNEDAGSVKEYLIFDVLIPAIKDTVADVVINGIRMALYGETGASGKQKSPGSRVSYSRYYDREEREKPRRSARSFDDIVLDTRAEAEEVLVRLDELIDCYGTASVADLCDLVGMDGDYTDNKYGWRSLTSAKIVRVREGYLIRLPKPTVL